MKRFAKVLLGCCICVWIVCFGQMASAADGHPANAPEFSMAILNERLSGIILKKYPKAHIDADARFMSACNAALNKELLKKSQPCLDSWVQPRPDSADFVFSLSMQTDDTHYQRIQYSSESSVNSITTIKNRYNVRVLPKTWEISLDYVPWAGNGSWAYDAIYQLQMLGVTEIFWSQMGTLKPATRYEFAVAIARLLDKESERAKDSPKVKGLIAKLAFEFEPKLLKLKFPLDHNKLIKELTDAGMEWVPRYQYLKFDLKFGKEFDKKLRKQIEDTIADYAAAWLKSNSSTDAAATQK